MSYVDRVWLQVCPEDVLDLLALADKYQFAPLLQRCDFLLALQVWFSCMLEMLSLLIRL